MVLELFFLVFDIFAIRNLPLQTGFTLSIIISSFQNDFVVLSYYTCCKKLSATTVVPTKIDSDVILCLQLLSKTLT